MRSDSSIRFVIRLAICSIDINEFQQNMKGEEWPVQDSLPDIRNEVSPLLKDSVPNRSNQRQIASDEERIEYTSGAMRCGGLADSLNSCCSNRSKTAVYWLEASGRISSGSS